VQGKRLPRLHAGYNVGTAAAVCAYVRYASICPLYLPVSHTVSRFLGRFQAGGWASWARFLGPLAPHETMTALKNRSSVLLGRQTDEDSRAEGGRTSGGQESVSNVVTCSSGADAMRTLLRKPASCDVDLPDACFNGHGSAAAYRTLLPGCEVIR